MNEIKKILEHHLGTKDWKEAIPKWITDFNGGDNGPGHICILNEPYMKLCVEGIGTGPRDYPLISVCHYGEQNGDAMRDPEMTFEIAWSYGLEKPDFLPVSFRNDYLGVNQEVVWKNDAGVTVFRAKLDRELKSFARSWSTNIRNQGFLEAFKKQKAMVMA